MVLHFSRIFAPPQLLPLTLVTADFVAARVLGRTLRAHIDTVQLQSRNTARSNCWRVSRLSYRDLNQARAGVVPWLTTITNRYVLVQIGLVTPISGLASRHCATLPDEVC